MKIPAHINYGFAGLWLLFAVYAFTLAPPDSPDTFPLIVQMIKGNIAGINPLLLSIFNLMGILPLLCGCFLIPGDHGRKFPAGLIVSLMMAVGAFALLPYLALRGRQPVTFNKIPWWVKLFDLRWTAMVLGVTALALVWQGLGGDFAAYFTQWQQVRFVHVMTLDFLLLTGLLSYLVRVDSQQRGQASLSWLQWMPLSGPILYLCLRPSLKITAP